MKARDAFARGALPGNTVPNVRRPPKREKTEEAWRDTDKSIDLVYREAYNRR